jgi:hypothetical protein
MSQPQRRVDALLARGAALVPEVLAVATAVLVVLLLLGAAVAVYAGGVAVRLGRAAAAESGARPPSPLDGLVGDLGGEAAAALRSPRFPPS